MSDKKTPAKPAEMKVSDNNTKKQKNAAGKTMLLVLPLLAVLISVIAGWVAGNTGIGIGTATILLLLVGFMADFQFDSNKAGPSIATVPTLSIRRKKPKKAPAPTLTGGDGDGDGEEAVPEPVVVKPIDADELQAAAAALDKLGYDVTVTKSGDLLSANVHEPQSVHDPEGSRAEVLIKLLMLFVVMVGFAGVVYYNYDAIKSIWGRKAPAGEVMPEFGDDMYKQVIRKDGKTVIVPRFTDGTSWAITVPGKDSVYIQKAGENDDVKVVEGMDTLTVVAKAVYPAGTTIHIVANDGRKPSMPRSLPEMK